uniref:Sugar fermentation stimulation protein C-terminal domain-containing protein n=1 Tax=viral metagenome TaxID=1070528 RepID=A0A6C0DSG7_9ZZZZ
MLHTLPPLQKATVVNRPSKTIKSPYVADIRLEDGTTALCHTPGLGCSGLVSTGRVIYVSKAANEKAKTAYTAQVSASADEEGPYYVGIHPMVSQMVASKLLDKIATNIVWRSEVAINTHTRLDFVGTGPDGKKTYVEVKNAMITLSSEKRQNRRAVFPEGYRKSITETVSPRAVKHAETLAELASLKETEAAYLVFIVPRDDCEAGLELNALDPIYCKAVTKALIAGVKVRVFGLRFQMDGSIEFNKKLPLFIP